MKSEELIHSSIVYRHEGDGCIPVPNDLYTEGMKKLSVGQVLRQHVCTPGTGYIEYRITRLDETGIYGIEIENTIRELTVSEVI